MEGKSGDRQARGRAKKEVELRPDLEDEKKGKDLSYLNEFPQFSVDEGVQGGLPPPREDSERRERRKK